MALARPIDDNVFVGEDDQFHDPSAFARAYKK